MWKTPGRALKPSFPARIDQSAHRKGSLYNRAIRPVLDSDQTSLRGLVEREQSRTLRGLLSRSPWLARMTVLIPQRVLKALCEPCRSLALPLQLSELRPISDQGKRLRLLQIRAV